MKQNKYRQWIGVILLVSLIGMGFLKPVQEYLSIPNELVMFEGQEKSITNALPVFNDEANSNEIFSIGESTDKKTLSVKGEESGESNMLMQMADFPIKNVDVKVLPDFKIVPGGQSIGVKLNTVGVLVVGHHLVSSTGGKKSPGEIAGIQVGDMITKINGKTVEKMDDVSDIVNAAGEKGEPLDVQVKRNDKEFSTQLTPIKDDDRYRLGLYIRDSAAGIGTLSFYHPESKKYGALGHVISDMDTKEPIVVNEGQIIKSTVTSIEKGSNGNPGEKLARFSGEKDVIGNITRNSPFGIFGKLNKPIKNGIQDKALPIALSHEVEEGPAKILTVVKGDEVKEFDVEVISSIPQKFPATKGLVIKITDEELLNETGGIVQGMSGSPIVQEGKVIGAVTHVFVNDPTSGYGVHIEWMLNEAGINIYEKGQTREAS